jgi:hypothetical protein
LLLDTHREYRLSASETSEIAELYVLIASLQFTVAAYAGSVPKTTAAHSTMIPRIRILVAPDRQLSQAQPQIEGKGKRAKASAALSREIRDSSPSRVRDLVSDGS